MKACWVGHISGGLTINLNEVLHVDLLHLVPHQSILESVPEEDARWQAQGMWACRWMGSSMPISLSSLQRHGTTKSFRCFLEPGAMAELQLETGPSPSQSTNGVSFLGFSAQVF